MSADWYFLLGVLGPPVGFLLVLAAIPLAIYSLVARKARRGRTRRIALILSVSSLLISAPLWITLLSGHHRNGDAVNYHDRDFMVFEVIAACEAVALATSLLGAARQRMRPVQ